MKNFARKSWYQIKGSRSRARQRDKKRDPACGRVWFNAQYGKIYGNELLIVLYVSPILGPITRTTAITRTATRERMIAYSTRP